MQVSSLCSPETKSRALRPARSMVRAAISTDRSRTAPTMAASSSGGCKEEAPGAEGPQPAVPPRPTAPAKALQGQAPGSAALCQAFRWSPSPARGAFAGRGTTAVPTTKPRDGTGSRHDNNLWNRAVAHLQASSSSEPQEGWMKPCWLRRGGS